jgi:hypothetical protein
MRRGQAVLVTMNAQAEECRSWRRDLANDCGQSDSTETVADPSSPRVNRHLLRPRFINVIEHPPGAWLAGLFGRDRNKLRTTLSPFLQDALLLL